MASFNNLQSDVIVSKTPPVNNIPNETTMNTYYNLVAGNITKCVTLLKTINIHSKNNKIMCYIPQLILGSQKGVNDIHTIKNYLNNIPNWTNETNGYNTCNKNGDIITWTYDDNPNHDPTTQPDRTHLKFICTILSIGNLHKITIQWGYAFWENVQDDLPTIDIKSIPCKDYLPINYRTIIPITVQLNNYTPSNEHVIIDFTKNSIIFRYINNHNINASRAKMNESQTTSFYYYKDI